MYERDNHEGNLDEDGRVIRPNKTQLKREADALVELGKRLAELDAATLRSLELENELLTALLDARETKSHTARKRQFKRVGKLLRGIDTEALQQLVEDRDLQHRKGVNEFHHIEQWRDRLIADPSSVSELLNEHPQVDRQRLNQLVRSAAKEAAMEKPPKSARQLFKFLRETINL